MIKLKVLKQFHDRETNELYKIGSIIEVTETRAEEILACKYNVAEIVEDPVVKDNLTTGKTKRKKK
jgi:hypothetical protein